MSEKIISYVLLAMSITFAYLDQPVYLTSGLLICGVTWLKMEHEHGC